MGIKKIAVFGLVVVTGFMLIFSAPLYAAAQDGNFSLQVTPSPLVVSMKPGTSSTSELKIRNNGDKAEQLKIEPKSFTIASESGEITLGNSAPSDVGKWVTFSAPTFAIAPGEWFTQRVTINLPENTGFSYSFALVISRQSDPPKPKEGETTIKGSVAVFTLISVDRPGAKRQLEVTNFSATKTAYEYLPVSFKTTFKSTGNTIVRPAGNIFIQRGKNDKTPLAVLPVNEGGGYILPGSTRVLTSEWSDGFPANVQSRAADNATPTNSLVWDWSKVNSLRIGRYTAKLVAVYNDGTRDVPLEAQTTFWVIPWKLIGGMVAIILLVLVGVGTLVKKSMRALKKPLHHETKEDKSKE